MNPLLAVKAAEILPKLATLAFVIAVPVTTVILVKKTVRKAQENNNFGQATNAEKPEFYAVQFFSALETSWYDWNVDEEECQRLIKLMPSKRFFSDVNQSYQKMTKGTPLTKDLLKVGSDDYKMISQLIEQIPN
ncbi:hypothetical protein ACE193_18330 [Bernardetia sp. OM2101]|uniref:hypothetical protein n=1 Tax=Bernardetia sp. OM2101 TaxID=3344876 RepID=UPI0035CF6FF4